MDVLILFGWKKVENLLIIHYTYRHANSPKRDTLLYDTQRKYSLSAMVHRNNGSRTQIAISNRISRLRSGNFGDFKRLSKDLDELRIHRGPGYSIYFGVFQNDIVILLCEGTKGTQPREIIRAQNYWNDFLEQMK